MSDNNLKSGKTGRSANMTYADKALLIDLALTCYLLTCVCRITIKGYLLTYDNESALNSTGRPGGMRDHIVKCAGF